MDGGGLRGQGRRVLRCSRAHGLAGRPPAVTEAQLQAIRARARELFARWEAVAPGAALETIRQHTQGQNPAEFDYRFNLTYGRQYTADHPVLAAVRALLDEETERRARSADRGTPDV